MIDFDNAVFVKLTEIDKAVGLSYVEPMLIEGEEIFAGFKAMRDQIVFTNKRVIAINIQGLTGKKQDFTSLPYSKVQTWSVQTAGLVPLLSDSQLDIWFSGLGKVHFEFNGKFDIKAFNRLIGNYVL
jgi:hypothetical protein